MTSPARVTRPAQPEHRPQTKHGVVEDVLGLLVGTVLASFGLFLLHSSSTVTGGTAGLALLLSYALPVPFGAIFVAVNLPFLIAAISRKGLDFTLRTLLAIAVLTAASSTPRSLRTTSTSLASLPSPSPPTRCRPTWPRCRPAKDSRSACSRAMRSRSASGTPAPRSETVNSRAPEGPCPSTAKTSCAPAGAPYRNAFSNKFRTSRRSRRDEPLTCQAPPGDDGVAVDAAGRNRGSTGAAAARSAAPRAAAPGRRSPR